MWYPILLLLVMLVVVLREVEAVICQNIYRIVILQLAVVVVITKQH